MHVCPSALEDTFALLRASLPRSSSLPPLCGRYLEADIAAFLLMRGPWAWVGAGVWGMSWPVGITFNSSGNAVPRPPAMDLDYGVPVDAT